MSAGRNPARSDDISYNHQNRNWKTFMETCQRDCDQPVTHFYLAATHSSGNPIYNISLTRTAHAALFFCPAQNPITRQCQPKQTNAKVRKRAAKCLRCGTGWHRLALICNAIRRFREGFGKPFFASSTKFESLWPRKSF